MSVFLNFCNTFPPWLKEKIWSKSKLKGNEKQSLTNLLKKKKKEEKKKKKKSQQITM